MWGKTSSGIWKLHRLSHFGLFHIYEQWTPLTFQKYLRNCFTLTYFKIYERGYILSFKTNSWIQPFYLNLWYSHTSTYKLFNFNFHVRKSKHLLKTTNLRYFMNTHIAFANCFSYMEWHFRIPKTFPKTLILDLNFRLISNINLDFVVFPFFYIPPFCSQTFSACHCVKFMCRMFKIYIPTNSSDGFSM